MNSGSHKLVYHFRDYLDQLLEDLEANTARADSFFKEFNPDATLPSEHAPYSSPGLVSFEQLFGLSKEAFPPVTQLSPSELTVLTYKMQRLLTSWHFYMDFPNLLPDVEKYKIMVNHWANSVRLAVSGESHIEICFSNTDKCPYSGYCSICDELNDDEEV